MCKSLKLLREKNAKLRSKNDTIYFGIFVFVSMILLTLFLPKIENFWLDVLAKGGIIGIISIIATFLLFECRARKAKREN